MCFDQIHSFPPSSSSTRASTDFPPSFMCSVFKTMYTGKDVTSSSEGWVGLLVVWSLKRIDNASPGGHQLPTALLLRVRLPESFSTHAGMWASLVCCISCTGSHKGFM